MTPTKSLLFAALLAISGCAVSSDQSGEAAAADQVDPRRGEEVSSLCFASSVDGFGETTRRTVVVSKGLKDYLIETYAGCFDLERAQSLAFDRHGSCLTRGDRIIGFDSAFGPDNIGPGPTPCTIKAIYEWDKDAEADEETDPDASDTPETSESE